MKTLFICMLVVGFANTSFAETYELASTQPVTCKHNSGYGTHIGTGSNMHQARAGASTDCVMTMVQKFEDRHGRTPNLDEADAFFDACVNICD